jgi:hypothetical protein
VALSYSKLNAVRKDKYLAVKALGYALASFISSRATVLNEGRIGENCFLFEDNTIQPFVTIGKNVTLWSGNHIGHHSVIDDHYPRPTVVRDAQGLHMWFSYRGKVGRTYRIGYAFCPTGGLGSSARGYRHRCVG